MEGHRRQKPKDTGKKRDGDPQDSGRRMRTRSSTTTAVSAVDSKKRKPSQVKATKPVKPPKSGHHHGDQRHPPSAEAKLLCNRQWNYTGLGHRLLHQPRSDQGTFTVASYNVLSQDLLKANLYLYVGIKDEHLDWNYRLRNLLNEIDNRKPDILCIQEMHHLHYPCFVDNLKDYRGFYQKRTGADKKDGCAIFYRHSKFELQHSTGVELYRQGVPALDRDNIAIVLLLRLKGSDETLCIATTHILFNPRRGDVKLAQLMLLLSEIDRLAHKGFDRATGEVLFHPIILCGDFNLLPLSHLYKFLSRGYLQYEGLAQNQMSGQEMAGYFQPISKHFLSQNAGLTQSCQHMGVVQGRLETMLMKAKPKKKAEVRKRQEEASGYVFHSFPLVSVYKHKSKNGDMEVTTHHSQGSCTVDYVWYSAQNRVIDPNTCKVKTLTEGPLKLIGSLALPTMTAMGGIGNLPNEVVSSDHVMLMAKFALS